MPLSPINLHYGKHELGKFNVHIIQIGEFLPEDNLFEYINSKEFQRKRQAKIFQKLDELLPSADKKDIVIFPELIAPYSIIESLSQYAKNYCFIVCGMVYDELYHNRCAVIDTDGNVYWQFKSLIAPEEPEKVQLAHANLLNEPVSTFVNTPVGDFAVLICYSFSDIEILNELREKVDSLIVICMNRAAKDYLSEASRIARDYYFHIILCNVAEFGGSAICGPFKHNLVAKSLGAGEGILDREIDLREFREAMRDPARYRRKAGRTYKTIPAGFHRKLNWYLGTHEACIESMFYDWERNRESTIELCEDISRNIDLDIADMNDCIDNREAETGIVTMKSLYLLEDLFEQVSNLVCVKELIKSKGFFTTERSFIDVNEFEYTFMKWEDFITQYRLIPNENELKAKLEEVAKCCRDSCIGYGRHTRKCNTVSLKFTRNIMLITCAEIDKSTLEDKDVTIVARVAPFRFNYTHLERPPKGSVTNFL
jgi:predicted amidohydrolase